MKHEDDECGQQVRSNDSLGVRPVSRAKSPQWDNQGHASVLGWSAEVHKSDVFGGFVVSVRYGDRDDWWPITDPHATEEAAKLDADGWFVRQAMDWAGLAL